MRTTVRFPEKDWNYIQKLVKEGEFKSTSDVIRAAVREFRKKHGE
ncbi:MAG: ribbon-helix-helix protein, CopG family [Candidatus Aenigmarchaeota archaeon]|nr:ribbon-helix-helix protein, CopG family [Candidatus Aenigmarchaeota archaeon]